MKHKLYVEGITKVIDDKVILDNIHIGLNEKEISFLVGPNGAGKTTFINILLVLTNKDGGKIYLNDCEIIAPYKKDIKKKFAYIPDEPIVIEYLTGYENLVYMSEIYQKKIVKSHLLDTLNEFELLKDKDKLVKFYSRGMRQRLSLCFLKIYSPEILILDEPTIGLDIVSVKYLKDVLLKFKDEGKTILITTHDIHFCQQIADKIIVINNGSIIKDNSISNFLETYTDIEEAILDIVN
ncbi:ABC transporter ATP-binding protein [Clostridium psychrophilum]|uniref:ABC transporter ATP-binding protein n=1 Tax=Clostridium psychrophilum TaxID=132926 RepID=UPI001C0AFEAB|nr:ABC transporter ATP-binding protein [Clostridium psychrophilum]MBU3182548.1 ABC transporter ATP-binding protein [Clostridium psychrophilum]